MSSDEEDEGVYAGVSLPQLGGGGAGPPPSDDEDDDEPSGEARAPGESGSDDDAGASGLLGAEAAFDVDGSAYELNPFRAAGPVDQPDLPSDQGGGKGGKVEMVKLQKHKRWGWAGATGFGIQKDAPAGKKYCPPAKRPSGAKDAPPSKRQAAAGKSKVEAKPAKAHLTKQWPQSSPARGRARAGA
mmetsp:Transcript_22663/g.75180  ORF Transcript_22663/g.75180 Transcript_22663/m.75180 type:complete len:186 (-) Transcript_22663:279-836(-)